MAAHSELQKWLQQSRKSWVALTQATLWLFGILSGFLLPPPVGVLASDEKVWLRLGQFIVAVVLGLVFFAVRRWDQPRHALRWCGVAVLFLAIAVTVFFRYQHLMLAWTGIYNKERVVIGSEYTAQGQAYTEKDPDISLDNLIFDFGGEIENIWTHKSISRRRLILAATFEACLPLFTICLMSVVQAIQCGARTKRRKAK